MSIHLLLVLLPPLMLCSQLVLVVNNFGFRPSYFLWAPSYLAPRGFVPRSSGGGTLEQLRMRSPRAGPGLAWPRSCPTHICTLLSLKKSTKKEQV